MRVAKAVVLLVAVVALAAPSSATANSWDDIRPTPEERLEALGIPTDTPQLLAVLGDQQRDDAVRFWAALALGRSGDRSATPSLVRLLDDPSAVMRQAAALALGRLEDASAIPALRTRLEDPSEAVRSGALHALGQIGGPAAAAALGEKLVDRDEPSQLLRANAARRLGQMKGPDVEEMLLRGLAAEDFQVRAAAAVELGQLGNELAVPALIETLKTRGASESQVVKAMLALETLTGQNFGYPKKYFAPATQEEKAAAIRRWVQWWNQQGS